MPSFELKEPSTTPQNSGNRTDVSIIAAGRAELDQMYSRIRSFSQSDIADILAELAGMSGFASELRYQIQRYDNRRLTTFRTKELDPFLEEVDRQFKIWSRYQAVRQMEWDASKGGM